jgi:hypothetical protein
MVLIAIAIFGFFVASSSITAFTDFKLLNGLIGFACIIFLMSFFMAKSFSKSKPSNGSLAENYGDDYGDYDF